MMIMINTDVEYGTFISNSHFTVYTFYRWIARSVLYSFIISVVIPKILFLIHDNFIKYLD